MQIDSTIGISAIITIGGAIASVASAFAITKTKVAHQEESIEELKDTYNKLDAEIKEYNQNEKVRVAVLENKQAILFDQVAEIKNDIKSMMTDTQEIKSLVLSLKKGAR